MVGAGLWGIMGAECSRLRKKPRTRREGSDERVVSARYVAARLPSNAGAPTRSVGLALFAACANLREGGRRMATRSRTGHGSNTRAVAGDSRRRAGAVSTPII